MLVHGCGLRNISVFDWFSCHSKPGLWACLVGDRARSQVVGDRGNNWTGRLEVCRVRGCRCCPWLLAECCSSWDQLQVMPFTLRGSVWGQWLGNTSCDIPKLCWSKFFVPFVRPSRPSTPTLRLACSWGRSPVGFVVMEEEADLRSDVLFLG